MQQRRRKYKSRNPRRRRRSKLLIIAVFAISAIALVAFNQQPEAHGVTEGLLSFTPGESPEKALEFLNSEAEANVWDNVLDTMPGDGCERMHINGLGGPLFRVFNDSNHIHYAEAEPMGIKPIKCDADLADIHVPLVRIRSCQNFYVYELKHSFPYLIPEAAKRLDEVGQRFNDSLRARGYGAARRTSFRIYRMTSRDWELLGLSLVLAVIVILAGGTAAAYTPELYIAPFSWGFVAYCAYLLIPTALHIKEAFQWHILRSRI